MKNLSRPKKIEMDTRWDNDVWNDWSAQGGAVIYLATPKEHEGYMGKFCVDWRSEVPREELRGYREERRRKGRTVRALSGNELKQGLFVIFGPETTAAEAVASLTGLADAITREGLLVGKRKNEDCMIETLSGQIS